MGNMLPPRPPLTRDDYRKNAEDALILANQYARNASGAPPERSEGLAGAARAQAEVGQGWIALLNSPGR